MTVRAKAFVTVGAMLAALVAVLYFTSSRVLLRGLMRIEEDAVRQDVRRGAEAITGELRRLAATAGDYAAWDETYLAMGGRRPTYARDNLTDPVFTNLSVELVALVHPSGDVALCKAFDIHRKRAMPFPVAFRAHLAPGSVLIHHPDTRSTRAGIVEAGGKLYLCASAPVTTSQLRGPIRGALAMARAIDPDELKEWGRVTHLGLSLERMRPWNRKPAGVPVAIAPSGGHTVWVEKVNDNRIIGRMPLSDIYGRPQALLRVDLPRPISRQGRLGTSYLAICFVLLGLLFPFLTLRLLEGSVFSRLAHLSHDVSRMGTTGDLSGRVVLSGKDELAGLAQAINAMLASLEDAHHQQHAAEEALRRAHGELETRVQERTAELAAAIEALRAEVRERELAQEALRESEEQLRQASKMEAVGRLAGGVAHDFNNLLTAVIAYGELALGRLEEGHPVRRHVDQVLKASSRAASLTQQLLALSRRQILQPRVLDLSTIVADLAKMLRRIIGEDIELVVRPAVGLASVRADPGQIEQVVMNLAVNARDAMPEGGRLTIETADVVLPPEVTHRFGVTPGAYVTLTVTDTGHGMDAETQTRIFEPFFTTKGVGQGTGLGLSTVYGIVKQSGGHITVRSEPGRGASFTVYLPCCSGSPQPAPAELPLPAVPPGTETVLVVEDEPCVREAMVQVLAESGYSVLEASNGVEGLGEAWSHAGPIHLAITDVVMPGMGGVEFGRRLGASRPETRVLYTSGYAEHGQVPQEITGGDGAFLPKPFTTAVLAQKVRQMLDR